MASSSHQYSQVPQSEMDDPTVRTSSVDHKESTARLEDGVGHNAELVGRGVRLPDELKDYSREELDALELKLKRKIDFRLLPMVILIYIMNYLDRNNIAAARISGPNGKGIQDELRMSSSQYQTSVSILFVGYLLMQVPSNLLLNKIGYPAIYLPACMIVWGVVSAATAAVHSYGGLIAIRFFLGFVEAAFFPGALFFLSSWYTRKELALRTAMLYSGSLFSGAVSGLIAAGITSGLDGAKGMRAWRWLFIIEGVVTVAIAFTSFFILPNFPRTTSWLSPTERALAIWRLEEDIGVDDWTSSTDQSLWHGFRLALKDSKVYVLTIMMTGIVSAGSVTNFFPTVVQTLKFGTIQTLLLTTPPYALAVITSMTNAWHADRTGERFYHIAIPLCVGVGAFILAAASTSTAARYVSMMLMVPGVYTGYVVGLAWISNSIPRPPDKRAAALAGINAISNCSSIWASYLYPERDGPRYIMAFAVNCGTVVVAIIAALTLKIMLTRLNRKLDRGEAVEGAVNAAGSGVALQKGFRFLV